MSELLHLQLDCRGSNDCVCSLKKLLDKPLIEALVTAFERLTEPEFLLKVRM